MELVVEQQLPSLFEIGVVGATQDRRAWVEIVAKSGGAVTLQSGVIADSESVDEVDDPLLWKMHDTGYNAADEIEHMFWNITRIESELMPPSVTTDINDPRFDHSIRRDYALGVNPQPDEVVGLDANAGQLAEAGGDTVDGAAIAHQLLDVVA